MYICICNGITDQHIAEAVERGASSLDDLRASLGVATCCGCCAEHAEVMLHERRGCAGYSECVGVAA